MDIATIGTVLGLAGNLFGGALLGGACGYFYARLVYQDDSNETVVGPAKAGAIIGLCLGIPFWVLGIDLATGYGPPVMVGR